MAVRIHYRHGLLHSSKDRQKHFSGHPFKVRATVVTDTNVTHFIHSFINVNDYFSFSPSDWLHMAAGPFLLTSEHLKDWRHICDCAQLFCSVMASNWCQQQCWIYKTRNSRHFPDACGAFNKKNRLSSFKMLCIKCSCNQKYSVSWQSFL